MLFFCIYLILYDLLLKFCSKLQVLFRIYKIYAKKILRITSCSFYIFILFEVKFFVKFADMNTFGKNLRLTTFGESHGEAIGGVIDGFPSDTKIDFELVEREMRARRPGSKNVSARNEPDEVEFLSGISEEGYSLGSPIAFIIRNVDRRSSDYDDLKNWFRPNHADFTYLRRYGIYDHRGGGRASARETACRVVGGAFAQMILNDRYIYVRSFLTGVGNASEPDLLGRLSRDPGLAETYSPSKELQDELMKEIESAKKQKDSVGGTVTCIILNMKAGIGNPVYDKLSSRLAEAMISINAARGFEIGYGMQLSRSRGSEVMDLFDPDSFLNDNMLSNFSGGIQGGITDGMPVFFNVAFKPTPTIGQPIPLLSGDGETEIRQISGRHDPCVALRAVSVVKAMAALTVADFILGRP